MLNIQEIMHTAYIFVLFCGYALTHFAYITYSPAQSFDCPSVNAKQPRRIWGNMSHPLKINEFTSIKQTMHILWEKHCSFHDTNLSLKA